MLVGAVAAYCVLRSGGDFKPEHVCSLAENISGLIALSDVEVLGVERTPLRHKWPGWWSKMNLFSPEIKGDIFYVDLDTVITGDISDIKSFGKTTLLSDFYWPERPASGVMYVTEADRAKVWEAWIKDPLGHMERSGTLGDQNVIGKVLKDCCRWQDEFPGRIVSYKVHVCKKGSSKRAVGDGTVPPDASIVCYHGKPRPWDLAAAGER